MERVKASKNKDNLRGVLKSMTNKEYLELIIKVGLEDDCEENK